MLNVIVTGSIYEFTIEATITVFMRGYGVDGVFRLCNHQGFAYATTKDLGVWQEHEFDLLAKTLTNVLGVQVIIKKYDDT